MQRRRRTLFSFFTISPLFIAAVALAATPGANATRLARANAARLADARTTASTWPAWTRPSSRMRTSTNSPTANGSTATAIPADRASFAMFDVVDDRNHDVLHEILEDAAKAPLTPAPPPPGERGVAEGVKAKVGAFYASGMDEKRIEEAGVKPLQEELDRIAAIKDAAGALAEIARLHRAGVGAAFAFGAETGPQGQQAHDRRPRPGRPRSARPRLLPQATTPR